MSGISRYSVWFPDARLFFFLIEPLYGKNQIFQKYSCDILLESKSNSEQLYKRTI